jgi:hypothetical protein
MTLTVDPIAAELSLTSNPCEMQEKNEQAWKPLSLPVLARSVSFREYLNRG